MCSTSIGFGIGPSDYFAFSDTGFEDILGVAKLGILAGMDAARNGDGLLVFLDNPAHATAHGGRMVNALLPRPIGMVIIPFNIN